MEIYVKTLNEGKTTKKRGAIPLWESWWITRLLTLSFFPQKPLATMLETSDRHWFSLLTKALVSSLRNRWILLFMCVDESPFFHPLLIWFRHRVFIGYGRCPRTALHNVLLWAGLINYHNHLSFKKEFVMLGCHLAFWDHPPEILRIRSYDHTLQMSFSQYIVVLRSAWLSGFADWKVYMRLAIYHHYVVML